MEDIKEAFSETIDRDNLVLEEARAINKRLTERCERLEKKMEEVSKGVLPAKDKGGRSRTRTPVKVEKPKNLNEIFRNVRIEKFEEKKSGGSKNKEDEKVEDFNHVPEEENGTKAYYSLEVEGSTLKMTKLENAGSEEELKKAALQKGLIFTRSNFRFDKENTATVLQVEYGKEGMTVQEYVHSKIKEIKMDDGASTGRAGFLYRLTITANQIQFHPKPNTEGQRKEEVNFFVLKNSGFKCVTLFRKKAFEVKKEVTGSRNVNPPARKNSSIDLKKKTYLPETKTEKGSRIDSYPEGWAQERHKNGYKGKLYNPDIAKKNREAKFAKRSEWKQNISATKPVVVSKKQ